MYGSSQASPGQSRAKYYFSKIVWTPFGQWSEPQYSPVNSQQNFQSSLTDCEWLRAHAVYLTSGTDCYGSFRFVYLCSDEYVVSVVIKVCSLLPRSIQRGRMHSITPCYYQTGLACINEWRVQWSEETLYSTIFTFLIASWVCKTWKGRCITAWRLRNSTWGW